MAEQATLNRALSPYHLDTRSLSFLTTLLHDDGLTQHELSEKLGVDEAVTKRAISILTDLAYVRHDGSDDTIFVTQRAREIAMDVKDVLRSWSETLSEGFTEEEKEIALTLLQRMNANVAS